MAVAPAGVAMSACSFSAFCPSQEHTTVLICNRTSRLHFWKPRPWLRIPSPWSRSLAKLCRRQADEDIYNLAFHFPQKRLGAVVASVFSSTSEENSNSVPADSTPYSNLDVETQGLKLNLNLPRRRLQISFTCNACGVRSQRLINPNAYARGTIFIQCAGCEVYHKLVDNLGLIEEYDFREYTNSNEGGEADLDSATIDGLTDKPSGPKERDDAISKE